MLMPRCTCKKWTSYIRNIFCGMQKLQILLKFWRKEKQIPLLVAFCPDTSVQLLVRLKPQFRYFAGEFVIRELIDKDCENVCVCVCVCERCYRDTAGQERFRSMTRCQYRGTKVRTCICTCSLWYVRLHHIHIMTRLHVPETVMQRGYNWDATATAPLHRQSHVCTVARKSRGRSRVVSQSQ